MHAWWAYAVSRATVRRALASALFVGPILVAINHGDAIVRGDVSPGTILKTLLTFIVPWDEGSLPAPGHSHSTRLG